MVKIVVLDGYTVNPGDTSWSEIAEISDLKIYDRTSHEDIISRAFDAEILLTNKVTIDESILKSLVHLKYISVLATGYNNIDLVSAKKRNIPVSNVPAYSPASVAQHVFAMILNFTNTIAQHDQAVKEGQWNKASDFCFWNTPLTELAGKTIGIVGFGDIGMRTARLAEAFGMKIKAYVPRTKPQPNIKDFEFDSLENVFKSSDFITLHCPLTSENEHFINLDLLKQMKKTAILINTARGPLINESDLALALNEKIIGGAALDVSEIEPLPETSPLLNCPNIVITPHIAWATKEARQRLIDGSFRNIQHFLAGKPINVVN